MGLGRHQISLAGIPPKPTKEKAYSQSFNPNRPLENDKKLFLMTAIRKTALHILDLHIFANFTTKKSIYSDAKLRHKVRK